MFHRLFLIPSSPVDQSSSELIFGLNRAVMDILAFPTLTVLLNLFYIKAHYILLHFKTKKDELIQLEYCKGVEVLPK